eukprot:snap_masked-scaffold_49-processed-gene-1.70-mRNA-1 protein AED:1.00 eAED:1.00 QI:0/0/0/0/1/1/2/0/62
MKGFGNPLNSSALCDKHPPREDILRIDTDIIIFALVKLFNNMEIKQLVALSHWNEKTKKRII